MIYPQTEAEVAQIIKSAEGKLHIQGGNTHYFGPAPVGEALSTAGLNEITLYEPGALTLVAGAGTPLDEIEQTIAAEGQVLAFEPARWGEILGKTGTPSLGGVIAGNISGPRRVVAGAARDCALGVRFVDGTGRILKNGGRVMKNVTGYDLVKLMAGSRGQLGVITEVAIKLLPRPETSASLVLRNQNADTAVALMSMALGTPFEVSAAGFLPKTQDVILRLEGFEASVAYRAKALQAHLAAHCDVIDIIDAQSSVAQWRAIRDVTPLVGIKGDLWRISVKPSDGAAVAKALDGAPYIMDWAGGLIWAVLPDGTDLRARLTGLDGHASLLRSDAQGFEKLGAMPPQNPVMAELQKAITKQFDPMGIFNHSGAA